MLIGRIDGHPVVGTKRDESEMTDKDNEVEQVESGWRESCSKISVGNPTELAKKQRGEETEKGPARDASKGSRGWLWCPGSSR